MSDWERLGSYVVARRVKLGFKQRGDFASAVGVSTRVISDIENGRRGNFDAVTIASLEEALGWETGSFASVAEGGEPSFRPEVVTATAPGLHGSRQTSDEIEMIYASTTMTPLQKLEAIRIVLELRAEVEAGSGSPCDDDGLRPERPRTTSGG
jgi:transcriptional regulator with XRE-family HTH domain